ncbi:2-dehydropantoate 2-reductase [Rhodoferax sp. PAMC 29310]|uniref:2-dehydropantoate 2-reductase n=1 Tax=Rhodoferax sp. PAMC 29310 TaxID=2822760 RepID=UPI001B3431A8|nr:2-dehydropantoate 2-reductase [Rhodoferax sp. PAMC 29310]
MKIAVLGAGSIGVYVGGVLLASGADVTLIGRATMQARIARDGLTLTDLHERHVVLRADQIHFTQDAAALAQADLVLVTVKSADTAQAAKLIAAHGKASALVLSLQNGVGNADTLRLALPGRTVLAGMVPFNVVQLGDSQFHRGTEGDIAVEQSPALNPWHAVFAAAQLPLVEHENFAAVQWGKLLLNLNNPINALSGLPLKTQLSQRAYRRCFALLIKEALGVLAAAGIEPAKVVRLGPRLLPLVLSLPDALFSRVARAMLRIDPQARSSMWEDLRAGRRTEVDYLSGAVVQLAESLGIDAPFNRRIVALMRLAESGKQSSMSGSELSKALKDSFSVAA